MSGRTTIQLVDDDHIVRQLLRRTLEQHGYDVLEASGAEEAVEAAINHDGAIDLLLTDVVMRPVDGVSLAKELTTRRPGLKVLLLTGYADDARVRGTLSRAGYDFLLKPFGREDFARRVEALLNAPVAFPPPMPTLTCPSCGSATKVEIVGVLTGEVDSDWRLCNHCHHLWSTSPAPDLFPLLVNSSLRRAHEQSTHCPTGGIARRPRFRVSLHARYHTADDDTWRPCQTEDLNRSGLRLRVDDDADLARVLNSRGPIEVHIDVPYHANLGLFAVVGCYVDVVRHVSTDIVAPRPGIAVKVRSYRLIDSGVR